MQNIVPPLTDYLKVHVGSQMACGVRTKITFRTDQQDNPEDVYDGDTEFNAKTRPKKNGEENAFHVGPTCVLSNQLVVLMYGFLSSLGFDCI